MPSQFQSLHKKLKAEGNDMSVENLLLKSEALKMTGWDEIKLLRIAEKLNAMTMLPFSTTLIFFRDKLKLAQ